jgi:Uma2 family endonuclease
MIVSSFLDMPEVQRYQQAGICQLRLLFSPSPPASRLWRGRRLLVRRNRMTTRSKDPTQAEYEAAAQKYLRSLPLEHFMEATPQATQRMITLTSFNQIRSSRPDVQTFNELLVQYPRGGKRKGQVVPDNMVVVHPEPIDAVSSFNTPFQPVGPFLVMEYVSTANRRKDYEDSFNKYERDLRVPYYLLFYPDNQELTLYHHNGKRYVSVKPDERERYAIPELEMEVAMLDGWVRYWFRGELLPLPEDWRRDLDETRHESEEQRRRANRERRARLAAEKELERLRAEVERLRNRASDGR